MLIGVEKWVQGENLSINREVFRGIKYPSSPQLVMLWNDLCSFTHASFRSWQTGFDYNRHKDEILCNYVLIQMMIYMTYHVLNRYLLNSNISGKLERNLILENGSSFYEHKREMKQLLHIMKESQNAHVKRIMTDFTKVWRFNDGMTK